MKSRTTVLFRQQKSEWTRGKRRKKVFFSFFVRSVKKVCDGSIQTNESLVTGGDDSCFNEGAAARVPV